jgi:SAM-dependent methyltransferase
VQVRVHVADAADFVPQGHYDVVVCNGLLQYVRDKEPVIRRMQAATVAGGINVVSLWSSYTPVPEEHSLVPVYCDDEDGEVAKLYQDWPKELCYYERDKPETSHSGMPPHCHSHIKLIARKRPAD